MRYAEGPATQAEVHVNAPPARVWALVTDIELPVRFSTELQETAWLDGAEGPAVGNRFHGRNHNPVAGEWETVSHVVACESERVFSWAVEDPDNPPATWRYDLEPDGAGTLLRQRVDIGPGRSKLTDFIEQHPEKEEAIVAGRLRELHKSIQVNLDGIKDLAEGGNA